MRILCILCLFCAFIAVFVWNHIYFVHQKCAVTLFEHEQRSKNRLGAERIAAALLTRRSCLTLTRCSCSRCEYTHLLTWAPKKIRAAYATLTRRSRLRCETGVRQSLASFLNEWAIWMNQLSEWFNDSLIKTLICRHPLALLVSYLEYHVIKKKKSYLNVKFSKKKKALIPIYYNYAIKILLSNAAFCNISLMLFSFNTMTLNYLLG